MKLTASYDRRSNELSLDAELDRIVGHRHVHSSMNFSTMQRSIAWELDKQIITNDLIKSLLNHESVLQVVKG